MFGRRLIQFACIGNNHAVLRSRGFNRDITVTHILKDLNVITLERISIAAPARADDLSGLPPAYVMTCEHDPLRDEAILYAMRLMAAGVPVELHNYPGTVHAFDFLGPSDISTRAIGESVEAFKRAM